METCEQSHVFNGIVGDQFDVLGQIAAAADLLLHGGTYYPNLAQFIKALQRPREIVKSPALSDCLFNWPTVRDQRQSNI